MVVEETEISFRVKFYHLLPFTAEEQKCIRTIIGGYREGPTNIRISKEWVSFDLRKGST